MTRWRIRVDCSGSRCARVEGATRGYDVLPEECQRLALEERRFRANWRDILKD